MFCLITSLFSVPRHFLSKKVVAESVQILLGKQKRLEVGNIDIKRDFGYAPEYIKAMWLMLQAPVQKNYIICSGKSIFLRDIVAYVIDKLNISKNKILINRQLFRPADIADIYGDNTKARDELGWKYNVNFF